MSFDHLHGFFTHAPIGLLLGGLALFPWRALRASARTMLQLGTAGILPTFVSGWMTLGWSGYDSGLAGLHDAGAVFVFVLATGFLGYDLGCQHRAWPSRRLLEVLHGVALAAAILFTGASGSALREEIQREAIASAFRDRSPGRLQGSAP